MRELARDGGIRLILKDWPVFGPPSLHAAQLVLGAQQQGRYPAAQAALMATKGRLTEAQIDRRLKEAGIDLAAASAAYRAQQDRWAALLARNAAQAAGFGFFGTPSYVVGMTLFPGVIDQATLRQAIKAARTG